MLEESLERTRALSKLSEEDGITGFRQHYFRNVIEWGFKSRLRYKEHGRGLLLYLLITVLMSKCIALTVPLPRAKSGVTGSVRSEALHGFAPVENLAGGACYLWRHAAGFL